MFLSIVIPVYNAEKYLDECLTSCLNQNIGLGEYEIICINDGSNDNSLSILRKYEKEFFNVFVIDQENKGVSTARNVGMGVARGDYIWFVDSDDFIRSDCLLRLKELAQNNYDIMNFRAYAFKEEFTDEEKELIQKGEIKPNKNYWGYPFIHLYRKKIISENNICFNENIKYGEDEMFYNDVFSCSEKVLEIKETYYFYRLTPDSAMGALSMRENQIKRIESVILSMVILKDGIENGKYTKEFSCKFLRMRYDLVAQCLKVLGIKNVLKYLNVMKTSGLFDFQKLDSLNLPSELDLKKNYLKLRFKTLSKLCYQKVRTLIKKMLPESLVKYLIYHRNK